ncbi:MAG TPA: recombinase-like helix-turn-helix domain-containing protein [Xanthobacteraceae bacterium]|nr:recombinase-like helix-turn-helix domain-containing protein [Xanthobacteraceae bacterium]
MSAYQFPYLSPHQSIAQEPTQWQLELASAMESIFAKGTHTLEDLIEGLNGSRVKPPDGGQWTADKYTALMRELGA